MYLFLLCKHIVQLPKDHRTAGSLFTLEITKGYLKWTNTSHEESMDNWYQRPIFRVRRPTPKVLMASEDGKGYEKSMKESQTLGYITIMTVDVCWSMSWPRANITISCKHRSWYQFREGGMGHAFRWCPPVGVRTKHHRPMNHNHRPPLGEGGINSDFRGEWDRRIRWQGMSHLWAWWIMSRSPDESWRCACFAYVVSLHFCSCSTLTISNIGLSCDKWFDSNSSSNGKHGKIPRALSTCIPKLTERGSTALEELGNFLQEFCGKVSWWKTNSLGEFGYETIG